jgi:hypothetical protein
MLTASPFYLFFVDQFPPFQSAPSPNSGEGDSLSDVFPTSAPSPDRQLPLLPKFILDTSPPPGSPVPPSDMAKFSPHRDLAPAATLPGSPAPSPDMANFFATSRHDRDVDGKSDLPDVICRPRHEKKIAAQRFLQHAACQGSSHPARQWRRHMLCRLSKVPVQSL